MTHLLEESGNTMCVIAKYQIDQWIESGEPMISIRGWMQLCIDMCATDLAKLDKVVTLCQDMEAQL
eukprot:1520760-Prorocentrum_lima.AAC.1